MSKRALIVDDSRSARVILSRMLEGYGLQVDSSESAELALEFLRQARPDVIFMDHLMPGMDGFQAIQAIKGNPDTATIPVVMYTSQEGELYVSQARALGAVGVLPKTVKHADVSRVLYQLRLLPERREPRVATIPIPLQEGSAAVQIEPMRPVPGELETAIRAAVAPLLKEHTSEMRRFSLASLEAFARRITTEIKPPAPPVAATPAPEPPPPIEQPPVIVREKRWPLVAGVAAIALIPTLVLALLYTKQLEVTQGLQTTSNNLQSTIDEQQAQLATLQQTIQLNRTIARVAVESANVTTEIVPYGEAPLAGSRLERLRDMLAQLRASNFRGKVKIATFVGEFCRTGSGIEGYSMATDDLPVKRCDLVGNPFEDSLPTAQRQSLAFANLVASLRQESGGALTVEVAHEGRRPSVPYPNAEQLPRVTAGEWNRIAAQNNRVEFATQPAGS
ncbi:MAG: response regulator [Steroidobacter sp.]